MFDPNQPLPDFQAQELEIKRRRAMADALRKQSAGPAPTGQMVGNQFVAPHWAQYLPGLMNQYQAGQAETQASKAEKDYATQVAQAKQQWQSSLPQATAGIPGREELYGPAEMGGSPELAAVPDVAPIRPSTDSVLKATVAGLGIPGNKEVAQLWGQGMLAENTREDNQTFRKEESAARLKQESVLKLATLTQQLEIAKERAANEKLSLEERQRANKAQERLEGLMIDAKKEIAAATAAARAAGRGGDDGGAGKGVKEVEDPNNPNEVIFVTNAEAASGKYRPAKQMNVDNKTNAAKVKVAQGQEQVREIIDELRANYDNLDRARAIPSTERGVLSNIGSSIAATGVGQLAGRFGGTDNQTSRDVINSSRIQLLNGIKQATGMSAQQLNSNVELQTWLKAVTDPSQSKQAVDRILTNIENFVTKNAGGTPPPPPPGTPPGGKPPAPSDADKEALKWAREHPSDPRAAVIMQRLGAK